ncbi:MarR family winged helix-turn-helix transcriptional regulator [Rhodomicrobium lacus]|uniref:MarR family winged helix-turn-helix transcriptional regulator n=2 Tax=Rhodomicrobium TaxID=1068 RepID=UPI001FE08F2A|nr:MarR family transcriptional regulator [Rhodomicrobium lacus]
MTMLDTKSGTGQTGRRRKKTSASRAPAIDSSIIHLLHRASQRASEIFAQETRDFDLTARQYAVVTTVARHEGLSQTDLVRLTGIDRSTLADVVQRLLKRGIIERERTMRDGRTYAVSLSAEGRELLDSIKPIARRADRLVMGCLGEEDGKLVAQILSRLLRKGDEDSDDVFMKPAR